MTRAPHTDEGSADESVIRLRGSDLAAKTIDDETIVLDLRSSMYFSANAAASVLWRELKHGATRTRLVHALLDEFDVQPEVASTDVDAFLADCRQRDLLDEGRKAT